MENEAVAVSAEQHKKTLKHVERVRFLARDMFTERMRDSRYAPIGVDGIAQESWEAAEAFYDYEAKRYPGCQGED